MIKIFKSIIYTVDRKGLKFIFIVLDNMMFSRLYVHLYLPFGQVIFSFILAYVWPYPPTPPPLSR